MWLTVDVFIKLIVNVDRGEWSRLSQGTAFLLEARGANGYSSAFNFALLESQLSFAVCAANHAHYSLLEEMQYTLTPDLREIAWSFHES